MNSEEREVKRLRIRGTVHGVGYRVWVEREALALGLGAGCATAATDRSRSWPGGHPRPSPTSSSAAAPGRRSPRSSRSTSRRRACSISATAAPWRIFRCSRRSSPVFPPRLRGGQGGALRFLLSPARDAIQKRPHPTLPEVGEGEADSSLRTAPNTASNSRCNASSTSCIVAAHPSSRRLVTP